MSWRDRIDGTGSFRGVRFYVGREQTQFGRRTKVHQYPLRDTPYTEDLGRRARESRIECYLLGADYDRQRDALMAALEQKGPGTLVHPYYGRMQVAITQAQVTESTHEGGMARFRLTFVEAGPAALPAAAVDTAAVTHTGADTLDAAAGQTFSENFQIARLPEDFIDRIQREITRTLSDPLARVTSQAATIAADIRAPLDLLHATQSAIADIRHRVGEPLRALNLYHGLFTAGDDAAPVARTTPSRSAQDDAQNAYHRLVQQSALAAAARAVADARYVSSTQALAAGQIVLDGLDAQMTAAGSHGRPIAERVFAALQALYAAVATDVRSRGAQLPSVRTLRLAQTTPALVVAWSLYADARRAGDIVARNAIARPGFVPGGTPLEILDAGV